MLINAPYVAWDELRAMYGDIEDGRTMVVSPLHLVRLLQDVPEKYVRRTDTETVVDYAAHGGPTMRFREPQ